MLEPVNDQVNHHRHRLVKLSAIILLVLAIPILPFLLLGQAFEQQILEVQSKVSVEPWAPWVLISLLAADIFLPIPSSGLITWAGGSLGFWMSFFCSTLGMMLGSASGYELARITGNTCLQRWSNRQDLLILHEINSRWGTMTLIITRPLPILAEAMVLIAGCGQYPRARFYGIMLCTQSMMVAVYAALGAMFQHENYFSNIIISAMLAPLVLTLLVRQLYAKPVDQHASMDIQPVTKQELQTDCQQGDPPHDCHAEHRAKRNHQDPNPES